MKRWWKHSLGLLLLLAYYAQGTNHIRSMSLTFDEGPHLATGYVTLVTGDFRLQPVHIHPPLANILSAAPLLLQDDLPNPRLIDGWASASLSAITDALVWKYPHPDRLALLGRLPILWLAVLLGALISRWARDLGGARASWLALMLFAFDPNAIAHGSLITTDMAATFFTVVTLYAAYQVLRNRVQNTEGTDKQQTGFAVKLGWMPVGILLGLALLSKVSTLLLAPVLLVLIAVQITTERHSQPIPGGFPASRFLQRAIALGAPAALTLWAGYGFELGPLTGVPINLPAVTHFQIYQSLQEHYTLGHPTYLLGQVSSHGWWSYFPIAFLLKTPLPTLIACVYGALRGVTSLVQVPFSARRGAVPAWSYHGVATVAPQLALHVFPIVYAATSLFSTVNIGYRHLLPLLPFLYVGVANLVGSTKSRIFRGFSSPSRIAARLALWGLLVWLILGTLAVAPDYLAFFNEIAGGPADGYRFLVDSNLDWGQNLWQLRDWMNAHGYTRVYYAHYSPARPQAYGVNAEYLPPDPRAIDFSPWQPAPGLYAIGSTVLQGPYAPDRNTYAWFRSQTPIARLGHALWLYEVAPSSPPEWAVLCADTNISLEQVRSHLGQPTLRVPQPDCHTAEVYAKGQGILISPVTPAVGQLAFHLNAANGDIDASVFRLETLPVPDHPYPVMTHGPADFLGFDVPKERGNTEILIRTYWEIREQPQRPLSLMAHLVAADGATVGIGDGMGFPVDQWQPGDLLVQVHRFPLQDSEVLAYRFGGYWLDTMERWAGLDGRDFWEVSP